jgi:hypothetical protein
MENLFDNEFDEENAKIAELMELLTENEDGKGMKKMKRSSLVSAFGRKIFVRCPAYADGSGVARIFAAFDDIVVNGKRVPILDGSKAIVLKDEKMELKNETEHVVLDIPSMHPARMPIAWIWVAQPRYKPGDDIKGFIVVRDRLAPYMAAIRKHYDEDGQVKIVNEQNSIIRARPIKLGNVVTAFEIPMDDLKHIDTGMYKIILVDKNSKELASTPVEIVQFEKKELSIVMEHPGWVLVGDDMNISVTAKHYHGSIVKHGTIVAKNKATGKEVTSSIDPSGTTRLVLDGTDKNGTCKIEIRVEDENSRQEKKEIDIIVASEPCKFSIMFPAKPAYNTIPFTTCIKVETPDGVPLVNLPVATSWERIGKMETSTIDAKSKTIETDEHGMVNVVESFDAEGTYQVSISASINGEKVEATKQFAINRITHDVIVFKNDIGKATYKDGEPIDGTISIMSAPETIEKITFGYIDLIADKIVESRRVDIKNGKVNYKFTGIVDFWGTASIDFYINPAQLGIEYSAVDGIDKAYCIHEKATATIEPKEPFILSMKVNAPKTTQTGKDITVSVHVDPKFLKDDIHVFGALVDQRIITAHDPRAIEKTFLKAPEPLDVLIYESKCRIPPVAGMQSMNTRGDHRFTSSMTTSYSAHMGGGPMFGMGSPPGFSSGSFVGSSMPPGGMPSSARSSTSASTSDGFNSLRSSLIDELNRLRKVMKEKPDVVITRENFVPSVVIAPAMIDAAGNASFSIKIPDAITTYDIVLFGAGNHRFGHETVEIIAKNDAFVQILNPSTMVLGEDRVHARALITNDTDNDMNNVLVIPETVKNVKIHGQKEWVIDSIPARKSRAVGWEIEGIKVGDAKFTIDVAAREYAERVGLDQPLYIRPPGIPDIDVVRAMITSNTPGKFIVPVTGRDVFTLVTINVLPSPEVAIIEGMESLAEYPHGCMEQTCSSTLPNVIVLEYLKAKGRLSPEMESKLKGNMQAGYDRMMGYHNIDGGFSYWGGQSSIFFTALGVMVLSCMKSHVDIPRKTIDDAIEYLNRNVVDGRWQRSDGHSKLAPGNMNEVTMTAFIVNAIAHAGKESPQFKWLADRKQEYWNDPVVLALVLESWGILNRNRNVGNNVFARSIADRLLAIQKHDGDNAFWERGSALTSEVESTARVVLALSSVTPPEELNIPLSAISYMLSKRNARGWYSTTDTLYASMAITAIGSECPTNFTMNIKVDGNVIRKETVTKQNMSWKIHDLRNIFIDDLAAGDHDVSIEMIGDGKCHVVIEKKRYRAGGETGTSAATAKLACRLMSKTACPLPIGMKFAIQVDITPSREMESVMVEIPVPAIAKLENLNGITTGTIRNSIVSNYPVDHVEIKKDTVCVFHERISEPITIEIPFVTTLPGQARVDGKVYEMYKEGMMPIYHEPIVVELTRNE